jgi:hypothetical protein
VAPAAAVVACVASHQGGAGQVVQDDHDDCSALLADVDVAEQVRLLRDIEIKGLLQRHHGTHQHQATVDAAHDKKRKQYAGASSNSSSRGAKKAAAKDTGSDRKQLNIAALLTSRSKKG